MSQFFDKILIYAPQPSTRLIFVLDWVFKEFYSLSYKVTSNLENFKNSPLPKIAYTKVALDDSPFVLATDLLAEVYIHNQTIDVSHHHQLPALFTKPHTRAILPFDYFSMVFYLLSRYEEYTTTSFDEHFRYKPQSSIAYTHNFLHLPLLDIWATYLAEKLKAIYPNLHIQLPNYQFLPTYDIDIAWSYRYKGLWRTMGGIAKEVLHSNTKDLKNRLAVLSGKKNDPYFTFDWLNNVHSIYQINPIFFFLVGAYGQYDKNISLSRKALQELILDLAEQYTIGLHPSYASNNDIAILKKEKKALEKVLKTQVIKSRQHYLKLHLPATYQSLLKAGITEDYTLGYTEKLGFRASTAQPFYWFDLQKNEATPLRLQPFQVMDVTLKQFMKCPPHEAMNYIKPIIDSCKKVGGTFTSLWHNNSFAEIEGWQGWRKVYENMIKEAKP